MLDNKNLQFLHDVYNMYPDRVNKFDYSLIPLIRNRHTPITIICKTHGEFLTTPRNHLKSISGCYNCSRLCPDDVVKMSEKKWPNIFKFPLIEEELSKITPSRFITVTCKYHGTTNKKLTKFLSSKHGCLGCSRDSLKKKPDEFMTQFNSLGNNNLTLDPLDYKGSNIPIKVNCRLHGDFNINPDKLINAKQGCSKCGLMKLSNYNITQAEKNKHKFLETSSGLYVMRMVNLAGDINYKLGISKNVRQRVTTLKKDSGQNVDIIFYRKVNLYSAIHIEQSLLDLLNEHLIIDDLKFAGYTERFYLSDDDMSDMITYLDSLITSSTNMENAP